MGSQAQEICDIGNQLGYEQWDTVLSYLLESTRLEFMLNKHRHDTNASMGENVDYVLNLDEEERPTPNCDQQAGNHIR